MKGISKELYNRFISLDYEEEVPNLKRKNLLSSYWTKWYEISENKFHSIIWKSINEAKTLGDLVITTGTLHLALRILKVLKEFNLVSIDNNQLIFSEVLYDNIPEKKELKDISRLDLFKNDKELGQFRATWESSLKRAEIIHKELPISSNIFFCGDDDYTSLALSQYTKRIISVGDIDEELLDDLKKSSSGLNVYSYDVRNETEKELQNQFHAVHCDPIDDGKSLDLWLCRANELLTGKKGDTIFLNISVTRLGNRIVFLQNFLTQLGFYLKDIYKDLSLYKVAEEPYIDALSIKDYIVEMGFTEDTFNKTYISTDMLVFVRQIDRPILLPQEYFEVRRRI
ncbi:bis-aminopropyl spermidine synthase family protein [Metabacillus idriensis]|uniref:bis-aminopropyl spermidine synthase family protein n=1 Tax=Metabacillus idriensis TaxID=324768 RepID=UPI001749E1A2|nr:bis-aminopropyl spermidine synthase family protein [Metabacillus idriensis]